MKFIDLFAGIGGFRLGLEQANPDNKCVGFVEWDKFARQSYKAIHDTKGEYEGHDIQEIKSEELPQADLWSFGSPCTNISVAGNQQGLEGAESRMFFEVIRLLDGTPKEKKPSYLLMENVKNLLSSNHGADFAKVCFEMGKVGYDIEWSVLDSAEVVPQHRERIFIIGHLRGRSTQQVFPIVRSNGEVDSRPDAANTLTTRYGEAQGSGSYIAESEPPKVHQIGNISSSNSFGGNPQIGRIYDPTGIAPKLSTMQGGGQEPKVVIPVSSPDVLNKDQNGRRFKNNGDPEFTLTARDRHGILTNNMKIRKLTPLECWRLQGFPDWAFCRAREAGLSDSQLYKQAGNSVTVPVIKAIAERMELT